MTKGWGRPRASHRKICKAISIHQPPPSPISRPSRPSPIPPRINLPFICRSRREASFSRRGGGNILPRLTSSRFSRPGKVKYSSITRSLGPDRYTRILSLEWKLITPRQEVSAAGQDPRKWDSARSRLNRKLPDPVDASTGMK